MAVDAEITEEYQRFLDYDWSDERWQTYFKNLYPIPTGQLLVKFKKKWYKKNVDQDFDDTMPDPPSSAPSMEPGGGSGSASSPSSSRTVPAPAAAAAPATTAAARAPAAAAPAFVPPPGFSSGGLYNDGDRWAIMGQKASICFAAYATALILAIGAVSRAYPPYQALVMLVAAFVLEVLAKYGIRLAGDYIQHVMLDDVGVMPIMSFTLLMPGVHPAIRTFALLPAFLTASLSFAQICKAHDRLYPAVRDFFTPLASARARYQVMFGRAYAEILLGAVLIVGVCTIYASPLAALLYWNFMMMRYMMSPWTQAAFTRIDGFLGQRLGAIPFVGPVYAALRRGLFSFVDPESKKSGRMCSIL